MERKYKPSRGYCWGVSSNACMVLFLYIFSVFLYVLSSSEKGLPNLYCNKA